MERKLSYLARMTKAQKEELSKNGQVKINGTLVILQDNGIVFTYDVEDSDNHIDYPTVPPTEKSVLTLDTQNNLVLLPENNLQKKTVLEMSAYSTSLTDLTREEVATIVSNLENGILTDIKFVKTNGGIAKILAYTLSSTKYIYYAVGYTSFEIYKIAYSGSTSSITKVYPQDQKSYLHNIRLKVNYSDTIYAYAYLTLTTNSSVPITDSTIDLYFIVNETYTEGDITQITRRIPCNGIIFDNDNVYSLYVLEFVKLVNGGVTWDTKGIGYHSYMNNINVISDTVTTMN